MADISMTMPEARQNALNFLETNYPLSKIGHDDSETEGKSRNLAEEKLQKARDKWN